MSPGGWRPGLVLRRIHDQDPFRPGNVEWTKSISSKNTSGVRGVSWDRRRNKWHDYINVEHRRINLGLFDGLDDAARVRADAELKYWGEPTAKAAPKIKQRRGHVRFRYGKWEARFRKRLIGKFATQEEAEAAILAASSPDPKRIIRTIKRVIGRKFAATPPPRRPITLGQLWA